MKQHIRLTQRQLEIMYDLVSFEIKAVNQSNKRKKDGEYMENLRAIRSILGSGEYLTFEPLSEQDRKKVSCFFEVCEND